MRGVLSFRRAFGFAVSALIAMPAPLADVFNAVPLAGHMAPATHASRYQFVQDMVADGVNPALCPVPCFGPEQMRAAYHAQQFLEDGFGGAERMPIHDSTNIETPITSGVM